MVDYGAQDEISEGDSLGNDEALIPDAYHANDSPRSRNIGCLICVVG
jgi:hypothetical protein